MTIFRRSLACLLCAVCTLVVFSLVVVNPAALVYAEEADKATKAEPEGIDAVLLLDASGSMRVTDPLRLRSEATRLFTQFLRSSDRLAIVEFSDQVKVLRPLLEYNQTQDADVARVINSVGDSGEYTDLHGAVQAAWDILKQGRRGDSEQVVILLSDGKMEPPPEKGNAQTFTDQLIEELLPELRSQSIPVYSLAFSEQSDKDLLAQISGITNAVSWYAGTSDKIHEYFAEMFLTVKKPQMQPLTSRGFKIDSDIQEATFYINREKTEEVTLTSPSGSRITSESKVPGIKWFKGELFDVITIDKPESGQWQLAGLAKNLGFATLLTNLKLSTNWPATITAREPFVLEARLFEFNKPVVLPDMSGEIQYAFQVTPTDKISSPIIRSALQDDGKNGDRIANDGIFSAEITLEDEGEYRLQVVASAPTFERRQQVSFRVKPPLVSIRVVSAEEALTNVGAVHSQHSQSDQHDDQHDLPEHAPESKSNSDFLRVELSLELISARNIEVELLATDHEKRLFKLPLTRIDNAFEVSTAKLPKDGEYSLRAKLVAEGRRGKRIQAESQPLQYVRMPEVNDEEVHEIVIMEDKKEAPVIKPSFPWLYFVLLLIINSGLGFAAIQLIKKQKVQGTSSEIGAVFLDASVFEQKVLAIEQISQLTDVDLEDPRLFSDEQTSGDSSSEAEVSVDSGVQEATQDSAQTEAADGADNSTDNGDAHTPDSEQAEKEKEEE